MFRSVVLLSAVGTACGGAVETVGGYPAETRADEPESTSGSTSSGGSSSGGSTSSSGGFSSGGSTSSSGGGSSSSSGGTSTSSSSGGGSTSSSGGEWACKMGEVAVDDAYCCADETSCPNSGGSGSPDGGTCQFDCAKVCDAVAPGAQGGFKECWLSGTTTISYACGACGVGRLPEGTKLCPEGETLGERLARQAYYEGVSVVAFERLAGVLVANGAPADLVARARRAAEDEARHAAIFRGLARAHGAEVPEIALASAEPSLVDLAIENATEGCVRETLGAAITLHQSLFAESEDVRMAFAAISDDEAAHAALSWDLKVWFDDRLAPDDAAKVEVAHRAALEAAREATNETPDATGSALGLPSPARARRMLDLAIEAMAA